MLLTEALCLTFQVAGALVENAESGKVHNYCRLDFDRAKKRIDSSCGVSVRQAQKMRFTLNLKAHLVVVRVWLFILCASPPNDTEKVTFLVLKKLRAGFTHHFDAVLALRGRTLLPCCKVENEHHDINAHSNSAVTQDGADKSNCAEDGQIARTEDPCPESLSHPSPRSFCHQIGDSEKGSEKPNEHKETKQQIDHALPTT